MWEEGSRMWPHNENENVHFPNGIRYHVYSIHHEESGFNLHLDLPTVSCSSCVSYPRRSGQIGKSNHLGPIYISFLGRETLVAIATTIGLVLAKEGPRVSMFLVLNHTKSSVTTRFVVIANILDQSVNLSIGQASSSTS